MKVLHVIPAVAPAYGGPSLALAPMCRALMARGVGVQIASTDAEPGGHIGAKLNSPTSYEGVPAIFFRKDWSEAFKYSRSFTKWLNDSVTNFDLVHIHGVFSHSCFSAARACQRNGVPYLIRPLGNLDPWSLRQKPARKRLFLTLVGYQMLRGAAAVQYTSATEKKLSESALNLNHGVVIPLGVELSRVEAASSKGNALSVLDRRPYVLVLSRLQATKGIDVLIDAFVSLLKDENFRQWQLVIAGDGPSQYLAALKRKIDASKASESVVLAGWLDGKAKADALRHASLLALPSYHENFGLCAVEALSRGVPVLVSPHVSLATEIESSRAGWVCEVSAEALAHTMAEALNDHDERLRRGAAGRALVSKLDWDEIAGMLIELYESIQTNRPRKTVGPSLSEAASG